MTVKIQSQALYRQWNQRLSVKIHVFSTLLDFKPAHNQNGQLPEKELENPIYGEGWPTDTMALYAIPSKQENKKSMADHEFDNPVYGIEDRSTHHDTN